MFLTATTQTFEVLLSATVATNQLPFVSAYADITTTAFTPGAQNGVTNNVTAVTAVAAPAASTQRELRCFNITNSDTVAATVTVRLNDNSTLRTIIVVTLPVNSSLTWSPDEGWCVVNDEGCERGEVVDVPFGPSLIKTLDVLGTNSTRTITTNNAFGDYVGRASAAFTSVSVAYRITTGAGTYSYVELAVYKGPVQVGNTASLTFCGFTSIVANAAAAGLYTTAIAVTNVHVGDELWVVIGAGVTAGSIAYRIFQSQDQGSGFSLQAQVNVSNNRPSTGLTLFDVAIATGSLFAVQGT